MRRLLVATRNAHKVGEIRAILDGQFECWSLEEFRGAPEVVEDAATFAGNATKKAVELAKWISAKPALLARAGDFAQETLVLADDSGLEVDALGGAPGVHSARFAALDTGRAGNSSSAENNGKLLRLLKEIPLDQRTARFRCVLAVTPVIGKEVPGTPPDGAKHVSSPVCYADEFEFQTQLFDGVCEGSIGFELRGSGGFGYDPLFFPRGYTRTFGELAEAEKNQLSHRAKALALMKEALVGSKTNK